MCIEICNSKNLLRVISFVFAGVTGGAVSLSGHYNVDEYECWAFGIWGLFGMVGYSFCLERIGYLDGIQQSVSLAGQDSIEVATATATIIGTTATEVVDAI